jgi:drug/metabolite transporter (DMT)-like permease
MSLQAPSVVFWRTLIAALAMGLWLALKRPALLRLKSSDIAKAVGIGFIVGTHWICFFTAIELANVSVALVGFAATSFFTAFTEPLIDRRPIRPHELLLGLIVAAGIALIVGIEREYILGLSVALFCALLAAIFPVLNHRLVNRGLSSRSLLVYEMSGACFVAALYIGLAPSIPFDTPITSDWLPLLTLALLCTVFAHTMHIHLLRRLSAYTSSLALNFEPVHGIILAALIFQEYKDLHPGFYFGALTIITANIAQPFLERRRRAGAPPV